MLFDSASVQDPLNYSPHEKGSVELSNRDFRRFFPKATDFSVVTQKEIDQAQPCGSGLNTEVETVTPEKY